MSNQAVFPPFDPRRGDALFSDVFTSEWSLWDSLKENINSIIHPEKLPPLRLTSRPVKVREIWGESQHPKTAAFGSMLAHMAFFGLIAFALFHRPQPTQQEPPKEVTHLVAPELSEYLPM